MNAKIETTKEDIQNYYNFITKSPGFCEKFYLAHNGCKKGPSHFRLLKDPLDTCWFECHSCSKTVFLQDIACMTDESVANNFSTIVYYEGEDLFKLVREEGHTSSYFKTIQISSLEKEKEIAIDNVMKMRDSLTK